jgi:hypothetical protein
VNKLRIIFTHGGEIEFVEVPLEKTDPLSGLEILLAGMGIVSTPSAWPPMADEAELRERSKLPCK